MTAMSSQRITAVTITPVAFADPPLLNSVGVHEPFALRAVVELSTEAGLSGLGETYADEQHLAALRAAADVIVGADAYHTEQIYRRVRALAAPETAIASGLIGDSSATDRVFSPFEVACLDIQGQDSGRPVADLLGGAVRDEVPFSAYLFYKWAAHPGAEPDDWGEALDPELAPGDQPGRDGPPGRGHAEPHVRVRHALAVEDRGRGGGRAVRVQPRRDPGAGRARARGRTRPGRAGPAARAVPEVRPAQPGRHRLHAPRRAQL